MPLTTLRRHHLSSTMEQIMAQEKTLHDLFVDTLKDIYFAERHILKALPKMAKAAQNDQLIEAFLHHLDETEGQIQRLEDIFEMMSKPARGKTCDAIMGLLEEGKDIMSEFKGAPALDAGLVSSAQAVEHYEIARYGTLRVWAKELELKKAVPLLEQTLKQEHAANQLLTKLAEGGLNQKADVEEQA